jgi:hypothetical protein
VVLIGPGRAGDAPMFPILMNHLRVARPGQGRPRSRGIVAVIEGVLRPARTPQTPRQRGRPVGYDVEDYKGRNVVERSFNLGKQLWGLATRYDKLSLTYRGAAVLRAITLWLQTLGDTPYAAGCL